MARLYKQANFSIRIICKRCVIVAIYVPTDEHQFKPRFIVSHAGGEGVFRRLQQIHICASHVVNEVQITYFHILGIDREGVGAIIRSLEIDRYLCRDVARRVSTN